MLALFVPYAGRAGGGAGVVIVAAMIGVLAAVALPAYQDYTQRAVVAQAWTDLAPVRSALQTHFEQKQQAPQTLAEAGVVQRQYQGQPLTLNADSMVVSVPLKVGVLEMAPRLDENKRVGWHCIAGEGLRPQTLPVFCR